MFIPLVCSHVDLKVYRLLFLIYLSLFLIKKSFSLFLLFAHYLFKKTAYYYHFWILLFAYLQCWFTCFSNFCIFCRWVDRSRSLITFGSLSVCLSLFFSPFSFYVAFSLFIWQNVDHAELCIASYQKKHKTCFLFCVMLQWEWLCLVRGPYWVQRTGADSFTFSLKICFSGQGFSLTCPLSHIHIHRTIF